MLQVLNKQFDYNVTNEWLERETPVNYWEVEYKEGHEQYVIENIESDKTSYEP